MMEGVNVERIFHARISDYPLPQFACGQELHVRTRPVFTLDVGGENDSH
jgi:hypothetical protein